MARTPRKRKAVSVALPTDVLERAQELARQKDLSFDNYVSELVWVAVAEEQTRLRLLAEGLPTWGKDPE